MNALAKGYARAGRFDKCVEVLHKMRDRNLVPDASTALALSQVNTWSSDFLLHKTHKWSKFSFPFCCFHPPFSLSFFTDVPACGIARPSSAGRDVAATVRAGIGGGDRHVGRDHVRETQRESLCVCVSDSESI